MKQTTGFSPRPRVDTSGRVAVGQAGGVLLTSTVRAAGLDVGLSSALAPWRPAGATHDPAKVLLDLAITLALGGDTCADLAVVRAKPAVFGPVASDPTLSRTIARLAADVEKVLPAIDRARAAARRCQGVEATRRRSRASRGVRDPRMARGLLARGCLDNTHPSRPQATYVSPTRPDPITTNRVEPRYFRPGQCIALQPQLPGWDIPHRRRGLR